MDVSLIPVHNHDRTELFQALLGFGFSGHQPATSFNPAIDEGRTQDQQGDGKSDLFRAMISRLLYQRFQEIEEILPQDRDGGHS